MLIFKDWYFLILIPIVLFVILRRKKGSTLKFSSVKLLKKNQKKKTYKHLVGKTLIAFSFTLFLIALARPQLPIADAEFKEDGIDIALILDVSGSMESIDFKPNRLEVARTTIDSFIRLRTNDRLALVAFAGSAYTRIPLTLDHNILLESLHDLSVKSVKEQGTAIGMSLSVGVNRLKKSESESKIIILVTDGDNNAGAINPTTASNLAKDLGIKVYTIGVGTDKTILPVEIFGRIEYQEYEGGLNEELLRNIASTSGGKYFRAKDPKALEDIFKEIDKLEKTSFDQNNLNQFHELGFILIKLALLFMLLGIMFDKYIYLQIP